MALSKIVVKDFINKYTALPNAISAFTYPDSVPLNILYNGVTGIPVETGNYNVLISALNETDDIEPVSGVYSIVGNLAWQSFALAWGDDVSRNIDLPNYYSAPTGLIGIQKIVGAKDFSVALMSNNTIITWGTGNLYGQQYIPYINNYIKDIAVSDTTTVIIDWSGNVTGCGYLFNTLGNGYTGYKASLQQISKVSVADYYIIGITADSGLLAWGNDDLLPFDNTQAFFFTGVKQVCATNFGCIVLDSKNKVTGWGTDFFGQLLWPTEANNNIQKISCSDTSTVFLYSNKTITGFGKYIDANDQLVQYTIPDQSIQGHVLDIAASNTHTLLILDEKIVPPVRPVPPPVCTGIVYA
jgi:alpha-tubulin suppressor-like RCC1 family protein